MTIEYKFRGYDVMGRKRWVYGDLTHNKKVLKASPYLIDRVMVGGYEVYPESVGMYTGTKDMNGREIYVGDILKLYISGNSSHYTLHEVVLSDGVFGVDLGSGITPLYSLKHYDIEVIDNMFERNNMNKDK